MSATVGELVVNLVARTAAFDQSLQKSAQNVASFSGRVTTMADGISGLAGRFLPMIAAAVSVRKVVGQMTETLDNLAALGKQSEKLGILPNDLMAFRLAAEEAGTSSDVIQQALGKLQQRMGEAAKSGKGISSALGEIGLSLGQLQAAGPAEAMAAIAEGLKSIESASQRARIQFDLFGKSGLEVGATLRKLKESQANVKFWDLGSPAAVMAGTNYENLKTQLGLASQAGWEKTATGLVLAEKLRRGFQQGAVEGFFSGTGEDLLKGAKWGAPLGPLGAAGGAFAASALSAGMGTLRGSELGGRRAWNQWFADIREFKASIARQQRDDAEMQREMQIAASRAGANDLLANMQKTWDQRGFSASQKRIAAWREEAEAAGMAGREIAHYVTAMTKLDQADFGERVLDAGLDLFNKTMTAQLSDWQKAIASRREHIGQLIRGQLTAKGGDGAELAPLAAMGSLAAYQAIARQGLQPTAARTEEEILKVVRDQLVEEKRLNDKVSELLGKLTGTETVEIR